MSERNDRPAAAFPQVGWAQHSSEPLPAHARAADATGVNNPNAIGVNDRNLPHTPDAANSPDVPDRPGAPDTPDASNTLSAELRAAEEAGSADDTTVLTAVLDSLGSAHHRPFSRS